MHFIDKMPVTLNLGNQEEGLVTKIEVDCTAWYTQWPEGAVSVSFEPPTDSLYRAKRDGVVHTPAVYPADWEAV